MNNQIKNFLLCLVATSSLGFLPLKAQAETKTVIRCTAGKYYIQVQHNTSNGRYTYIAYDGPVSDQSKPSLIVPNGFRSGNSYTFNNRNYSYVVSREPSGQLYLDVSQGENKLSHEECSPTYD